MAQAANKSTKMPRFLVVLLVLALLLVAVRVAAPYVMKSRINAELAKLSTHDGQVGDVSLSLLGGQVDLHDVSLRRRAGQDPALVTAERVRMEPVGSELVRGRLLYDLNVTAPKIHLPPERDQIANQVKLLQELGDHFPHDIRHAQVHDGEVHLVARLDGKQVPLDLSEVMLEAENFDLRPTDPKELPTRFHLRAAIGGGGRLRSDGRLNLGLQPPRYVTDHEVRGVPVKRWNRVLQAAAGIDAEKGVVSAQAHIEGRGDRFHGMLRPSVRGLEVADWDKDKAKPGQLLKEVVASAGIALLEDDSGKINARVPISGRLTKFDDALWRSVVALTKPRDD